MRKRFPLFRVSAIGFSAIAGPHKSGANQRVSFAVWEAMIDLARIEKLHGKSVLVKSSRDTRTPAIGLRGSLQVENTSGQRDGTQVKVALDYPEMFTAPAHQLVIPLDVADVSRLLASSADEPYEITLPVDLEKEARDQSVVAPRATQSR